MLKPKPKPKQTQKSEAYRNREQIHGCQRQGAGGGRNVGCGFSCFFFFGLNKLIYFLNKQKNSEVISIIQK